jgi:peptidoglycan hydrolase FlgJ
VLANTLINSFYNEDNMDSISSAQIQNTLFNQMTEKNLNSMKGPSEFGKAQSEKEMEKVARDFESVFINKLFETMRKAIPKSELLDSSSMEMFQSMMDQEMAKQMAMQKGMGMGEMVYNDLSRMNKILQGEVITTSSQIPLNQKNGIKLGE